MDHPLDADRCPFCGSVPKRELRRLGSTYAASYAVVCEACRAVGPLASNAATAVARWNQAPRKSAGEPLTTDWPASGERPW